MVSLNSKLMLFVLWHVLALFCSLADCLHYQTYYMDAYCGKVVSVRSTYGAYGILKMSGNPSPYSGPLRCIAILDTSFSIDTIYLDVEELSICGGNGYIKFYDNDGTPPFSDDLLLKTLHAGESAANSSVSFQNSGKYLTIQHAFENLQGCSKSKMYSIRFTVQTKASSCFSLQFACKTGYCINIDQKCDGYNNCGDNSDEEFCTYGSGSTSNDNFFSTGTIVVIVVAFVLCSAGLFLLMVVCYRRAKRRQEAQASSTMRQTNTSPARPGTAPANAVYYTDPARQPGQYRPYQFSGQYSNQSYVNHEPPRFVQQQAVATPPPAVANKPPEVGDQPPTYEQLTATEKVRPNL